MTAKFSNEIWKSISEYEGIYEVSNFGRVRSLDRWVNNGKKENLRHGKILTPMIKKGYLRIKLCDNKGGKKTRWFFIHRLVLQAFSPSIILTPDLETNHKDFNKANNHIDNLSAVTGFENIAHYLNSIGITWNYNK